MSFDYSLIKDVKFDKEIMLAGNIQFNDNLQKLEKLELDMVKNYMKHY